MESTNGIIRKYVINITEEFTGTQVILEALNTTVKIHSVHPYTTYLVSVSAFTVGEGPAALVKIDTLEDSESTDYEFMHNNESL